MSKLAELDEIQQDVRDASTVDEYQRIVDELQDIERQVTTGVGGYADWAPRTVEDLLDEAQEDIDEVRETESKFSELKRKLTGKKLHTEGWTDVSIEELLVEASHRLKQDIASS